MITMLLGRVTRAVGLRVTGLPPGASTSRHQLQLLQQAPLGCRWHKAVGGLGAADRHRRYADAWEYAGSATAEISANQVWLRS